MTYLEHRDGHATTIRVTIREAQPYLTHVDCAGDTEYVRFHGPLAQLEGVWAHEAPRPSIFWRVEPRIVPAVVYETWTPPEPKVKEFRVAIDFDNVLHSYTSGWEASHVIADPPLPGAVDWLERLAAEGARIILHTCRLTQWHPHAAGYKPGDFEASKKAIWAWLRRHGLSEKALVRVTLWCYVGKPYADVYVDDKAIAFTGEFYGVDGLKDIAAANARRRIETVGA